MELPPRSWPKVGDLVSPNPAYLSDDAADGVVYRVVKIDGSRLELADAVTGEWGVCSVWEIEPGPDEIPITAARPSAEYKPVMYDRRRRHVREIDVRAPSDRFL